MLSAKNLSKPRTNNRLNLNRYSERTTPHNHMQRKVTKHKIDIWLWALT